MATRTNTTRMSRNALKCHRAARRRSKEQKPSNTVCYDVMLQHYGLESSGPINHYKKEVCRRRAQVLRLDRYSLFGGRFARIYHR